MINRRTIIRAAVAFVAVPVGITAARAQPGMSQITAYAFSFPALGGGEIRLADYADHPLLIVNTASLCGYTPQYAGLQELWTEFHHRGLMIIGIPPTISADKSPEARQRSRKQRSINMASSFRLRPKPWLGDRMRIHFTNGLRRLVPRMFHAGTFINISSVATAISPRCSPRPLSHRTRGSKPPLRERWPKPEALFSPGINLRGQICTPP